MKFGIFVLSIIFILFFVLFYFDATSRTTTKNIALITSGTDSNHEKV
jgi:hypothetical protein